MYVYVSAVLKAWCSLLTTVEPCWVTQQTQKQISSTLLCIIYCPNTFSSLLSHSTLHIGSHNSVCVCKCCIEGLVQPFDYCGAVLSDSIQKQISSTLLCIIYCPNTFSSLLSHSTLHIGSHNSVCVCKCCIEAWCSLLTTVEPCWVTQQTQKQISSTLLCT